MCEERQAREERGRNEGEGGGRRTAGIRGQEEVSSGCLAGVSVYSHPVKADGLQLPVSRRPRGDQWAVSGLAECTGS